MHMPKLKIDLSELEAAFDDHSGLISYYLDKDSGEIIPISDDTSRELEEIYESYSDDQTGKVDWETAFQEEQVRDWHQEELREADKVEQNFGDRFVKIPALPSHEGFDDMEEFIETVHDLRLQQRLTRAIRERHPFRNFKMALEYYPDERQRWFQFKSDRMETRLVEWLESEGIELNDDE
jgi:hypothetical protein